MARYHLSINGIDNVYPEYDEYTDAVRDAINEWLDAAVCPKYWQTDHMCCANHESARFGMCQVCKAMETASEDDQAWIEYNVELPYEIKLPDTPDAGATHIRCWED